MIALGTKDVESKRMIQGMGEGGLIVKCTILCCESGERGWVDQEQ